MTDLSKITNEELAKKLDETPQSVQDVLSSDALDQKLDEIREKYVLIDELYETYSLQQLTLLLATGVMKTEEFADQIEASLHRDRQECEQIASEILKMFQPVLIAKTLTPSFSSSFIGQAPIAPKPPATSIPSVPEFVPAKPQGVTLTEPKETPLSPAPFIIHEQSAIKADPPKPNINFGTSRQTFIRPQFTQSKDVTPPPVATVQFGSQIIGKQSTAGPKIVDYSSPKTQPEPNLKPQNLSTRIEPPKNDENTINLRDLPR